MNKPCRNADARAWFVNGLLHRDYGPAIEYHDGTKSWYYKGHGCYFETGMRVTGPRHAQLPGFKESP